VAILGIESLVYGVEDVGVCTKFFDDFGLPLVSQTDSSSSFKLEEGSRVVLRRIDDPALPRSALIGPGVREVVWGVDSPESLEALCADLRSDREIRQDDDGTVHFLTDCGLPFALRLFAKTRVVTAPDPLNAAGTVNRLNRPRAQRNQLA
jgi:hypothetical protein